MHIKHLDHFKFSKKTLRILPKNANCDFDQFHVNLYAYQVWIFKKHLTDVATYDLLPRIYQIMTEKALANKKTKQNT